MNISEKLLKKVLIFHLSVSYWTKSCWFGLLLFFLLACLLVWDFIVLSNYSIIRTVGHNHKKKIQVISIVHNLQLNTRTQCTYRKMQNKCIYQNKNKAKPTTTTTTTTKKEKRRRTNRAHQDISTTTPWTIIHSTKEESAKQHSEKEGKSGKAIRLLNVPSICKHIIR